MKKRLMMRRMMMGLTAGVVTGLTMTGSAAGAGLAPEQDISLTVYSSADPAGFDPQRFIMQQRMGYNPAFAWSVPGFGVVKEVRTIDLRPGLNELRFTDVAAFIDPTTVSFVDLTNPTGTSVLEQNFQFDLVSADKLYEKYVDREVELRVVRDGREVTVTGTVLSVTGGMFIVQSDEGIQFIPQGSGQLRLPPLPLDGLVTKPTLLWKVRAEEGGRHEVRTTYQTAGLTWRADYNLVLNDDETKADLGAWVSLMNLSGVSYTNAQLKLVAGDVQRVQQPQPGYMMRGGAAMEMAMDAGFEEKAFFEYHLYTLPRRTDVLSNSTQQLMLFPTATDVNVEKVLIYQPTGVYLWGGNQPNVDAGYGLMGERKVDVFIRFDNARENNLGMPLPAGKVRVYKMDDADGTLEFIGEDLIDHTPREESLRIQVGKSFDMVGERTQTSFNVDTRGRVLTESYTIELRNRKDHAQTVLVREMMSRGRNWELTQNSQPFKKLDASTIEFEVNIPADGTRTVMYTVKYTW